MKPKDIAQQSSKEAILVLEDGTSFRGTGFGAVGKIHGEVVFNTGMVGYTEALTDPSYHGQILIQTYPLIGNYGITRQHFESDGPKVRGYVIHELCREPSHWSAEMTLDEWLEACEVPGIEGVDTRMLTKKLRAKGTQLGILEVCEKGDLPDTEELKREVKHVPDPNHRTLAHEVATTEIKHLSTGQDAQRVVLIDCGVKTSILNNILRQGYEVIQVLPELLATNILGWEPQGVVLSNGPGDPKMCQEVIETTASLIV